MYKTPGYSAAHLAAIARTAYKVGSYANQIPRAYSKFQSTINPRRYAREQAKAKGGAAPLRGRKTRKRYKKRRVKKMSKGKLSMKVKQIDRSIRTLRQESDASLGNMTYRSNYFNRMLCGDNVQAAADVCAFRTTEIEAAIANLKFYDPSNPATLVTASGATGSFQRNILIPSATQVLEMRNNYQTDIKVKVYLCSAKDDTDQLPSAAWTAGITDGGNLTATTDLQNYPTDYDLFNDLYKSKVVFNGVLSPGQTSKVSHIVKNIEYSPSTVDTHALDFQKEYKSFSMLVVAQGVLSHDSALNQQGYAACGLDVCQRVVIKVRYEAGINLSYVHVSNNPATPTNGFVQSHQPIPDNIAYSIS